MGNLFGGGGSTPAAPKVVRMPTQNNPTVLAAQRRTQEAAKNRGGRDSTILTDALRSMTGSAGRLGR